MTKEVAMAVADSRTFRSGNSEAVRLPRNVAFGREVEVTIVRSGDVLTIYPARKPIGELVKQLEELPRPSEIETRDDEVLPEPSGLWPLAYLLDTNVAIHLRDGDKTVTSQVAALESAILLSIISRVELEGGVYRDPAQTGIRRPRLDAMLAALPVLAFDDTAADAYRQIVEAVGYSRQKLLDRMIAAQALVHRATLVTLNANDFRDVPGLELLSWWFSALFREDPPDPGNTSLNSKWVIASPWQMKSSSQPRSRCETTAAQPLPASSSYIRERDKRTILASEIEQRGPVDCFHTFNETYNDCVVSAYKYLIGPALDWVISIRAVR
jgi:tRNA(fMet)-specific endonuclease VapC